MLKKYYRFSKVAAVSIEINKDGQATFNACLLTINGNELSIEQKQIALTDLNDLKKHIPEKTVIAINLSGRGVLIRQTKKIESEDALNFASILPNANADDFYTQIFPAGDKSFLALCRNEDADNWIIKLKELGFVPVSFSLGPFVADQVIPQLNVYGSEFIFHGHVVHFNEKKDWVSYKYEDTKKAVFPFKLENEQIDEALIVPYASAFQLALYPDIDLIQASIKSLEEELGKKADYNKVKAKGFVVLIGLFCILLCNFLLFSFYNSANLKLAVQLGQNVKLASNAESLSDSLKTKQQLLDAIGWEGKTDKSILIDQLAQLLPAEVKWQQVAVDPLMPNPDHGLTQDVFVNREIRVSGTSERLIPVNEWIVRLKTRPWVKNVQLQSYYFNNELNTGQFVVAITY